MFINYTEFINSIKTKKTLREYKDNSQISYIYESSFTINKLTSYNSAHIDYVHLIFYFLSIIVMCTCHTQSPTSSKAFITNNLCYHNKSIKVVRASEHVLNFFLILLFSVRIVIIYFALSIKSYLFLYINSVHKLKLKIPYSVFFFPDYVIDIKTLQIH